MAALSSVDGLRLALTAACTASSPLEEPSCLRALFCCLPAPEVARAATVCRLWHEVAQLDQVWETIYLREHDGKPEPGEWAGSYQQAVARQAGLCSLMPPQQALVKGTACCYNAASACVVAFSARQRLLSAQHDDGRVRSVILEDVGMATADKPILVSTDSQLVVLAAFDGVLQIWDVSTCTLAATLGHHPSYVTSMAVDGDLLATTCSGQVKLWSLAQAKCLFTKALATAAPVQIEPRVVLSARHGLLALANHAFPAGTVQVLSAREGSYGDLLQQLPVNAVSDMALHGEQLVAAACFQGRSLSSNAHTVERPFTIVATTWHLGSWKATRLVSPRRWSDYPVSMSAGLPVIHITQGMLLCCTLRAGIPGRPPACAVHAWRLPHAPAGRQGTASATSSSSSSSGSSGGSGLPEAAMRLTCTPRRAQPPAGAGAGSGPEDPQQGSRHASTSTSTSTSASSSSSGGGGRSTPLQPAAAAAAAPPAASFAPQAALAAAGQAAQSVMLAVPDGERDAWLAVLDDTVGKVASICSTPRSVVFATDLGVVLVSAIPHVHGAAAGTASAAGGAGDRGAAL